MNYPWSISSVQLAAKRPWKLQLSDALFWDSFCFFILFGRSTRYLSLEYPSPKHPKFQNTFNKINILGLWLFETLVIYFNLRYFETVDIKVLGRKLFINDLLKSIWIVSFYSDHIKISWADLKLLRRNNSHSDRIFRKFPLKRNLINSNNSSPIFINHFNISKKMLEVDFHAKNVT